MQTVHYLSKLTSLHVRGLAFGTGTEFRILVNYKLQASPSVLNKVPTEHTLVDFNDQKWPELSAKCL